MRAKELPPVETLRKLLDYDEVTGEVIWKQRASTRRRPGDVAGGVSSGKYARIGIEGQQYLLHRIIWKLYTGEEPGYIDHLNGNKLDNRICNLNSTTSSQNNFNRSKNYRNTSGHRGVTLIRRNLKKRWLVQLSKKHIGHFATFEEAVEARLQAERDNNIYVREVR